MSIVGGLAADAFEKRERVRMLEMMNTPVEYEARKKAYIDLQLARLASQKADEALQALNPYQSFPFR